MDKPEKLKVAIQGVATSFHEVAAITYFKDPIETLECLTFHELCEKLKKDEADYAVMAIENSIAGSILPNYFLLQKYHFAIVGELYLPIQMHLLALPGVKMEDLECIESHPMAIRQCSEFLHSLQGVEIRESDDTALSARRVRELNLTKTAAIANEYAANKYGLNLLQERIETHKKNFTRFLILTKLSQKTVNSTKASLWFEVANKVGSLADALLVLKSNDLNLSKIQSIPVVGKPNEYSIHIDVEWTERKNYDLALEQLSRQVMHLNVLGEYPKGTIRF